MKFRTKLILFTSTFIILFTTISLYLISDRLIQNRLDASIEDSIAKTNQVRMILESHQNLDKSLTDDDLKRSVYRYNEFDVFYDLKAQSTLDNQIKHTVSYRLLNEDKHYFIESYSLLGQSDLVVVGKHNISSLIEESEYSQMYIIISCLVMVVMTVILTSIFSKSFTQSIKRLEEASKKISQGDYDQEIVLKSKDELGDLAHAFNHMAQKTKSSIQVSNQAALKSKQLYSALTHEINTPLTSILGYSELLLNRPDDEALRSISLKHIYDEGKRLSVLSDNLLSLTNEKLNRQVSSIKELLYKSVKTCLSNKSYQITYEISGSDLSIMIDYNLMMAVFINIIKNAMDAMISDGKLTIVIGKDFVSIKDNGVGITKDKISYIFDSFYKGKDDSKHLGLGLTLVKDIVDLHGDHIDVKTSKNGSEFIITFTTSIQVDYNLDESTSYTFDKEAIK